MCLIHGKTLTVFSKWKIFNRYFCNNCGNWFRTGCFTKEEENNPECKEIWDDICPKCGALSVEWYHYPSYLVHKVFHRSAHTKWLEKKYKKSKGGKDGSNCQN